MLGGMVEGWAIGAQRVDVGRGLGCGAVPEEGSAEEEGDFGDGDVLEEFDDDVHDGFAGFAGGAVDHVEDGLGAAFAGDGEDPAVRAGGWSGCGGVSTAMWPSSTGSMRMCAVMGAPLDGVAGARGAGRVAA